MIGIEKFVHGGVTAGVFRTDADDGSEIGDFGCYVADWNLEAGASFRTAAMAAGFVRVAIDKVVRGEAGTLQAMTVSGAPPLKMSIELERLHVGRASEEYPGPLVELVVPVADLAALSSPFDGEEWGCDPIDPDDVLRAAAEGRIETRHWHEVNVRHRGERDFDDAGYHVRRMAFFLVHGSSAEPLEIEVEGIRGVHGRLAVRLFSGNHRFGAAILRGEAEVRVLAPEQELDDVLELLPNARRVDAAAPGMAP